MTLKCALAFFIMLLPAYSQTGNPATSPPVATTSTGVRTAAGTVVNLRGEAIVGAKVTLSSAQGGAPGNPAASPAAAASTLTDSHGHFTLTLPAGAVVLKVSGQYLAEASFSIAADQASADLVLRVREVIPRVQQSIVISATTLEPEFERRNDVIYKYTLFNRDDQIFDTLAAGINAGQHEGGGKSIEVRRFGFNLDHGGVNGGLKVLVDDVQQNQSTQGHGQGYLGQLKSLTPELVEGVDIINGPFSAEYGDFSGLGVVHIRLKESLPERFTARVEGGSFDAVRTFLAYSPRWKGIDSYLALEDSRTNGPFINPLHYIRDNLTGNLTRHLDADKTLGFKLNASRNLFDSSGQLPLDQVAAGTLNRFGYVDPFDGGRYHSGSLAAYYKQDFASGNTLRADGFISRSLFDLWSNFTFFLNDPVHGDEIQQHDSRLQEGFTLQWLHPGRLLGQSSLLTVGTNFQDNQINVGLFHTEQRQILQVVTSAHAHVTNAGWYAHQGIDFNRYRVRIDLGLRYDVFRFAVADQLGGNAGGLALAGALQPKANLVWTPWRRIPLALHTSYGRGISSADARGVVQYPNGPKISTTDFYQLGTSLRWKRLSFSNDVFLIDRSHQQVYVPDDGSIQFTGPSRSYGWEAKTSVKITRFLSFTAGLTQVSNAFYRGISPRIYVDSAPHTVANSGLTLENWKGIFASLRYRHISGYIVNATDNTIPWPNVIGVTHASGADVVDLSFTKKLPKRFEFNFAVDNLTNKNYYETQNYFISQLSTDPKPVLRLHGTPGYPIGFMAGLTFRFE